MESDTDANHQSCGQIQGDFHNCPEDDTHGNGSQGDRLDSGVYDEPFVNPDQSDPTKDRPMGRGDRVSAWDVGQKTETRSSIDEESSRTLPPNNLEDAANITAFESLEADHDENSDGISTSKDLLNKSLNTEEVKVSSLTESLKEVERADTKDLDSENQTHKASPNPDDKLSHGDHETDDKAAEASKDAQPPSTDTKEVNNKDQNGVFMPKSRGWSSYGSTESSCEQQHSINANPPETGRTLSRSGSRQAEPEFSFRRISTRHKLTLFSIGFSNFCASAAFALLAPFFPQEANKKGVDQTVIGIIFGMYDLVIFLSAPILGSLITKIGAKFMFISGVLVSGVCGVLFGCLGMSPPGAIYIVMCFLTRSIEALGTSALIVASFAIVAHEFPNNVATIFGGLETFSGFGMMVGPPLGGALYQLGGFGLPFFTLGCLLVTCGLLCMWLLPAQNHNDVPFEGSVISLFLKPSAFVITMSIVVGALALGTLDPTLAGHFSKFNLTPFWIGLMFLIAPAVYALTAPIWGWIGDNKGYTISMIVGGNLMTSVTFIFIGPAPFLAIPLTLWLEIVCLIFMGLFLGCALIPTFKALIDSASANGYPDSFATYGIVSGLFNSAFSFGAFLGPTTLGGAVNDKLGFPWSACICALCFVVVAVVMLLQVCIRHQYHRLKNEKDYKSKESSTCISSDKQGVMLMHGLPVLRSFDVVKSAN